MDQSNNENAEVSQVDASMTREHYERCHGPNRVGTYTCHFFPPGWTPNFDWMPSDEKRSAFVKLSGSGDQCVRAEHVSYVSSQSMNEVHVHLTNGKFVSVKSTKYLAGEDSIDVVKRITDDIDRALSRSHISNSDSMTRVGWF